MRDIQAPTTIKGANGISLFIVSLLVFFRKSILFKKRYAREPSAPIQKARTMAEKPCDAPRRRPTESPSLASPKPIALPRLRNQIEAKKANKIGPENQSRRV